jgi:FkbM family methyltransferase
MDTRTPQRRSFLEDSPRLWPESRLLHLGSGYGGWRIPRAFDLGPESVCICAGAGEDLSFDVALAREFGCRVHIFDPTPRAISHFKGLVAATQNLRPFFINNDPENPYRLSPADLTHLQFYPLGLAGSESRQNFYLPRNPDHVSCSTHNLQKSQDYFVAQCVTVQSVLKSLGFNRLDLLKLDIEGSEYEVLECLMNSGPLPRVLLVEFHALTGHAAASGLGPIKPFIDRLHEAGMRLVYVEGMDATFVKAGRDFEALIPGASASARIVHGKNRPARGSSVTATGSRFAASRTRTASLDRPPGVLHVNTHDVAGGAAKVAERLCAGQRRIGHASGMLVGTKNSSRDWVDVFDAAADPLDEMICLLNGELDYEFQGSYGLYRHPAVQSVEVIHCHNLHGGYFNPFSISVLSHLKPMVWTLHDMQAITGHCAHAFDCEKWLSGCGDCPYPGTYPELWVDRTAELWAHKKLVYAHSKLHIVVPSQWLKKKVERSILQDHPMTLVYNGIDCAVFKPGDRLAARARFGIPSDAVVVGCLSHGGALVNIWKGGHHLQCTLDEMRKRHPGLMFLNAGAARTSPEPGVVNTGHLDKESDVVDALNAMDVFLYTPRADNCPLVVIEALACGVPVVSFRIGGIPELVRDGRNGCLVNDADIPGLLRSLEFLIQDPSARMGYAEDARLHATMTFDLSRMLAGYQSVYEESLASHRKCGKNIRLFPIAALPESVLTRKFLEAEVFKASLAGDGRMELQPAPSTPGEAAAVACESSEADRAGGQHGGGQGPAEALTLQRAALGKSWLRSGASGLPPAQLDYLLNLTRKLLQKQSTPPALSPQEKVVAGLLLKGLAEAASPSDFQRLLPPAMLYLPPLRLEGLRFEVPHWLKNDYFRYQLERPSFFEKIGEVDSYNAYLLRLAEAVHAEIRRDPQSAESFRTASEFLNFANPGQLFFSDRDLRPFYVRRAQLMDFVLRRAGSPVDFHFAPRSRQQSRLRLGVYLRAIHPASEVFATLPVFADIDKEKIEVHLFVLRSTQDPLERYARQKADSFTVLPENIKASIELLRQADLDILFFGNNITTGCTQEVILAHHRIARHQGVHFCSPVSSGSRYVDFFLLGELIAGNLPAGSGFAENRLTIEGSGICFDLTRQPAHQGIEVSGEDLGIPPGSTVFISGANCFNIIPELLQTWAAVLDQTPGSLLVLYPFDPAWGNKYPKSALAGIYRRVFSEKGVDPQRLIIIDALPGKAEIDALNRMADVYLDAVPYNGATSLLDPLRAGIPVVVADGGELCFAHGAAMLRELGMPEFIAADQEEYVHLAVRLGSDASLRQTMRERIRDRMSRTPDFLNPRLYGRRVSQALLSLFPDLHRGTHLEAATPKNRKVDRCSESAL